MNRRKGMMYIRRLKSSDHTDDFRTSIKMVLFQGKYGVFRHGYKSDCLIAGHTKKSLKKMFFSPEWEKAKKFYCKSKQKNNNE